jgi:uncharacterized protein YdbL (DUF1318 family)
MKKMGWITFRLLFIIGIVLMAQTVWSSDIKDRMKARLPAIIAMKVQGVIGESNSGYLQILAGKAADAQVVEAENQDRRTVYELIAKQQKTTMAVVGQQRARIIRDNARSGEWIQTDDGKWLKK